MAALGRHVPIVENGAYDEIPLSRRIGDVQDVIRGAQCPAVKNTGSYRVAAFTHAKILGEFLGLDAPWAFGDDGVDTGAACWICDGAEEGVGGCEGSRKKEGAGGEDCLHVEWVLLSSCWCWSLKLDLREGGWRNLERKVNSYAQASPEFARETH